MTATTQPGITPDELWEKYHSRIADGTELMRQHNFLAALHEYGALVRTRDAEIAMGLADNEMVSYEGVAHEQACESCAAAISREPLP